MPLIVLLVTSSVIALIVFLLASRYPAGAVGSPAPSLASARAVGETVAKHPTLRRRLDRRLDPATATGLALTIALVLAIGGGVLLAILAYLVRASGTLVLVDRSVAQWGHDHAGTLSTHGLNAVTQLGNSWTVVALAAALAVVESIRAPSRWIVPFLAVVISGETLLAIGVKDLAHRVRPTLNPIAATLGPSFPSGHSAKAAAFFAAAALLLGRRRGQRARALLTGLAAGIAVAVACSRVLLDVHWVSDVVAGLALGWAWFAVCSIAFGGRLLRFGAAVESAAHVAQVTLTDDTPATRLATGPSPR